MLAVVSSASGVVPVSVMRSALPSLYWTFTALQVTLVISREGVPVGALVLAVSSGIALLLMEKVVTSSSLSLLGTRSVALPAALVLLLMEEVPTA